MESLTKERGRKKRYGENQKSSVQEMNVEGVKKCSECKSKNLVKDYERAELFCADCGLVIDENIMDLGPEWRAFDFEQVAKRTRVGAPMTYRIHDKGLSSLAYSSSYGPFGKSMSPTKSFRLKKWQTDIINTSERSFIFALGEIDRMASALGLPINIREAASMLYRKAMSKGRIRGRSIEAVSSAILYIVCRQYGVPRTLDEIKTASRVSQKEIRRAHRFLLRELDLKIAPTSPADFVPRFCSKLGLGGEVRRKAVDIIKEATEKELTNGRGPIGVAAAAIYVAAVLCGEHRTQKEIAEVTAVTEVTIRNRYKELAEELDIGMLI